MQDKSKDIYDFLWANTQGKELEFIFQFITNFLCYATKTDPFYSLEDLKEERDLLEVTIEILTAVYCFCSNADHAVLNYVKIMKEMKLMDYLVKLKFQKFGKEIFDELNLEISEKVDNGYIVLDKNIYN